MLQFLTALLEVREFPHDFGGFPYRASELTAAIRLRLELIRSKRALTQAIAQTCIDSHNLTRKITTTEQCVKLKPVFDHQN